MRSCVNAVFVSAGSARIFAAADRAGGFQLANLLTFRPYSISAASAGPIRFNRIVAYFVQNTGDVNLLPAAASAAPSPHTILFVI